MTEPKPLIPLGNVLPNVQAGCMGILPTAQVDGPQRQNARLALKQTALNVLARGQTNAQRVIKTTTCREP